MQTIFRITDKEFPEYLKITACGKAKCFDEEITLEFDSCEKLTIEIERISATKFIAQKIKNPFLRFLLFIPIGIIGILISALMFFINADNSFGIKIDEVFSNFSPFTIKKTFSIANPDNRIIDIKITDSKFDKNSKRYSLPDIVIHDESTTCINSDIVYSEKVLKQQWSLYTIPAFCILWIVTILLNILCALIFTKVIHEIPLNSTSFNVGGIIGMAFSSIIVFALWIVITVIFVRLYKMCKIITEQQK